MLSCWAGRVKVDKRMCGNDNGKCFTEKEKACEWQWEVLYNEKEGY